MNNFYKKYILPIVWFIGLVLIISICFSQIGCDNFKCYPEYDPRGNYIGFRCGGKF